MQAQLSRVRDGLTEHGTRTTLRSWCADIGVDRDVAEMMIGHAVGSVVERSHQGSTALDRRRAVAEQWARFVCDETARAG